MSLVLLEAAAHGRCVLAASIPANVDAMEGSIMYFDPDDFAQLAEQIGRCLKQADLRDALGRKARDFVQRRYSWNLTVGQYERIYREAMTGKR